MMSYKEEHCTHAQTHTHTLLTPLFFLGVYQMEHLNGIILTHLSTSTFLLVWQYFKSIFLVSKIYGDKLNKCTAQGYTLKDKLKKCVLINISSDCHSTNTKQNYISSLTFFIMFCPEPSQGFTCSLIQTSHTHNGGK